jgi:hypothetical protein
MMDGWKSQTGSCLPAPDQETHQMLIDEPTDGKAKHLRYAA